MEFDIIYEKADGIAVLTINRPEVMNVLRMKTMEEMLLAIEDAAEDPTIGVLVITGRGDQAFSNGSDLEDIERSGRDGILRANRLMLRLATALRTLDKPVIASINGLCIGSGNELNLFCDLSIASERAQFGHTEGRVGTAPLWGATQLLPRIIGERKAREMVFLGEIMPAEEAYRWGLVNKVVPHDQLYGETRAWCMQLLHRSPQSLRLSKISLNFESDLLFAGRTHGLALIEGTFRTEEMQEGLLAWKEKRQPNYSKFRTK